MAVGVLGSLVLYILLASLFHAVYPNDVDGCPPIHVQKNRIVKTKESLNNGAKYIRHQSVDSAKECYELCCETEDCNLGMLSYKNISTNALGDSVVRTCYLFDCGSPSKCKFSSYNHYATIEFEENRDKSNKIDQNLKSGSTNTHEEICPLGVPVAMCRSDPCINAVCPGSPLAFCKPSFCGSCHAEFYDDGKKVNCYAQDNEADNTKNINKYKWLDSGILPGNNKPDSTTHHNPVHNAQDLESRLHEMTRDNQQSHHSTRVSSARKNQDQHKASWNNQGSDGAKHQESAHTSRGSSSHRKQKPAPTDPPFHEWRKFIDNNPEFPTKKLATEKPKPKHIPKQTAKPIYKESTKPFHQWREFIDNNPKYDKKPKTTKTHPTKPIAPKTKPKIKENKHQPVGTKFPPKVDNDITSHKRNITDVKVVIETNHLRIVENKAVVPLAIFLVIALLLLIMVGLRLRMMKNRLRRKAFATDDADYLINGMYL